MSSTAGPRDQQYVVRDVQQPGESNLSRCCTVASRDASDDRIGPNRIILLLRPAQRTERDERDAPDGALAQDRIRGPTREVVRILHADDVGDLKRSQLGSGGRSEKIRTYNFKENRVTDHRINLTNYSLDAVLAGDLDPGIYVHIERLTGMSTDEFESLVNKKSGLLGVSGFTADMRKLEAAQDNPRHRTSSAGKRIGP